MEIKILKGDGKVLFKEKIEHKKVVDIKKEIIAICENRLIVKFKVPIIDIHGYWTPDIFLPKMSLDWVITLNSAFQKNFPYISFFNQDHQNIFTFGCSNLIDDSALTAKMNQEEGTYDVEFIISVDKKTKDFKLFFDLTSRYWVEIIDDYRKIVQPGMIYSFPKSAYFPVYCSWYVFHADFNQKKLQEQIKVASNLGFKTFIVDDGWCFDECKRVNPLTIKKWYENIGDWQISKKKFNNFKRHLDYAHKFGFKYMVWIAPFIVGSKSEFYKKTICEYLSEEHEGYKIVDPKDEGVKKILSNVLNVFRKNKLDGLKIDFIDAITPSLEKPRGRMIFNLIENFIKEIREINPFVLIEFRQKYATPITVNYATQFRAGDVPFDFLGNLYRITHIRLCLGDKVPVHSDPAYWRFDELELNVARHMIVCLIGVPMISMDFKKMCNNHKKIVKNYIDFYWRYLNVFKNGKWQIKYKFENIAYITVEYINEIICFIFDEKCVDEILKKAKKEKIIFLNLGNENIRIKNCISYDFFGQLSEKGSIPIGGRGEVS